MRRTYHQFESKLLLGFIVSVASSATSRFASSSPTAATSACMTVTNLMLIANGVGHVSKIGLYLHARDRILWPARS